MELKAFENQKLDEILAFARQHPWKPEFPEAVVRRFVTKLVSTPDLVFDLHGDGRRMASAVLIDRIANPGNLASLEVLGMNPGAEASESGIIEVLLELAKARVPPERDGLQVAFTGQPPAADLLQRHGLQLYYQTFDMVNDRILEAPPSSRQGLRLANERDDERLYRALREAFRENIDASLSPFEEWRNSRRALGVNSKTWIIESADEVVGFVTLIIAPDRQSAEIRTLGVLPSYRRQGLAEELMRAALEDVRTQRISKCELTVAADNQSALGLYRRMGFRDITRAYCYRWVVGARTPKL